MVFLFVWLFFIWFGGGLFALFLVLAVFCFLFDLVWGIFFALFLVLVFFCCFFLVDFLFGLVLFFVRVIFGFGVFWFFSLVVTSESRKALK